MSFYEDLRYALKYCMMLYPTLTNLTDLNRLIVILEPEVLLANTRYKMYERKQLFN